MLDLKEAPFEDLDYAKIDFHRSVRQGAAEVIYGAGKTPEQIRGIVCTMGERGCRNILVTRIGQETADYLKETIPMDYHAIPRLGIAFPEERKKRGHIVVATGGTSDMAVAEEAALTAEARILPPLPASWARRTSMTSWISPMRLSRGILTLTKSA